MLLTKEFIVGGPGGLLSYIAIVSDILPKYMNKKKNVKAL